MVAMKHPRKWHGGLFNVVLYWYEKIKEYVWVKLIGLLPTQSPCLMQSAVEDVIVLEYMQQIDHGEHRYRRVSSTYNDLLWESNPTCLPNKEWVPDCDCTDNSNAGDHDLEPKHYHSQWRKRALFSQIRKTQ
jgi:hypothetical protein